MKVGDLYPRRTTVRAFGSCIFQGYDAAMVAREATNWCTETSASPRSVTVPVTRAKQDEIANAYDDHVEIDMTRASSAGRRALLDWVWSVVRNSHIRFSTHVVCVHGAHLAPASAIAGLCKYRNAVVVLSTCKPDSEVARSVPWLARVRVSTGSRPGDRE